MQALGGRLGEGVVDVVFKLAVLSRSGKTGARTSVRGCRSLIFRGGNLKIYELLETT